jgi:dienelactone hydrolase
VDLHAPFIRDANEPLGFRLLREPPARLLEGVRELRFEYSSRGDRVPGRLLLPAAGDEPRPLVLVQAEAMGRGYAEAVCGSWARSGAAVAAVDLPLHGERASAKLSAHIRALFDARSQLSPTDADVWISFVGQAVNDLHSAVDGLSRHAAVDAERIGFAGFGLGSIVGTPFCAHDPRIRAVALVLGGGGFRPASTDPAGHAPQLAPRPTLFVNASHDGRIPSASAEALHRAAPEESRVLWFDCTHADLPDQALAAIWQFLARELRIGP